jgi:DNA polymerase I
VMFGEGDPVCDTKTGVPLRTQKLRVLSRTPENQLPQVTKAVLQVYSNRGNKMAEWFLEWSALEKLRGTFVTGLDNMLVTNHEGLQTIHASFKQHGTVTGRFSSTKPNLQQMPRGSKIRNLFVAGPEHVLIVADYDQIELRCLAKEANERNMIRTFLAGVDIHKAAAASMYRIPLEDVDDVMRQTGKTANFGTAYGAGPERIAAVAGVSVKEGEKFLERYYAGFPGLLPWKARMLRAAKARGDRANIAVEPPYVIIPPIGRYRRLPELFELEDWKRWHAERQAINAIIQGMASYITKLAMLRLDQDLRDLPARMVVQVHDELAVRVDERYIDEVLPLVVNGMSDVRDAEGLPILGEIPLLVSANVGYSWSDAKGK